MTNKKSADYRSCHGILLFNKPIGLSSNQALQKVKRLFKALKAGHTGSLDPLATGMLPICFGRSTKLAAHLFGADKGYQVTATLGITTTTGDAEGKVISTQTAPSLTSANFMEILKHFCGDIEQIPPMYSALKHQGQPLYRLARQGVTIERMPRKVTIYELKLIHLQQNSFSLDVRCSKGTYMRTLVEDIGKKIGCGAHVTQLHRYAIQGLPDKMFTLDELYQRFESQGLAGLDECLLDEEISSGVAA